MVEAVARPLEWVVDAAGVDRLGQAIDAAGIVAIDTESNSFHAYYERVCLVQLATPECDFLLDPRTADPRSLAAVLSDRRITKILHAAENDVAALKGDFGLNLTNLFDTMLAAGILGWERRGLAALLETHFGIQQDKRFQRYDWGERPLDPAAIEYARGDVAWLIALREIELAELLATNKLGLADTAFRHLEETRPRERRLTLDGWRRLRDVGTLSAIERGALAALWAEREAIAQELDRPPFKVISESVLVHLARRRPTQVEALSRVRELGASIASRYGTRLVAAAARGAEAGEPAAQVHAPRDEAAEARLVALKQWRRELAERQGVPSEAVLPIRLLRELAADPPSTREALARHALPSVVVEQEAAALLAALATSPEKVPRKGRGRTPRAREKHSS